MVYAGAFFCIAQLLAKSFYLRFTLILQHKSSATALPLLLRWQWQVGVFGGRVVVFPRGLLQDRVSRSSKHIRCQAAYSRLSGFRARRWLGLPLQMQPRLLCIREHQEEETKVSVVGLFAAAYGNIYSKYNINSSVQHLQWRKYSILPCVVFWLTT